MTLDFQLVASGLQFPVGPVAMADGSVLVVEIRKGCVTRIAPNGACTQVAEVGGGPNGAAIGLDGALYICNNGGMAFVDTADGMSLPHGVPDSYETGSIQRVDIGTGAVTTLYTHCGDMRLNGPNDIVFDQNGGFWFTDLGKITDEYIHQGRLFYAKADGSSITCARNGLISPNGVGLSPDGATVYVSETYTSRLWAFDVEAAGQLSAPAGSIFAPGTPLGPVPGYELFDSLALQADGRVCVATIIKGGITLFDPAGGMEFVPAPRTIITNICFGGADMRDAWLTASGTGELYKVRWPSPGHRLHFNA